MTSIETRIKNIEEALSASEPQTIGGYDAHDVARLILEGEWTGPGEKPDLESLPVHVQAAHEQLLDLGFEYHD